MPNLDHIIIAIADLDDGIRQVEELTGVRPVVGGFHPTGVTKNALMSLGGQQYLEIIALRDDIEMPKERRWMLEATELKPLGWAAFSPDIWETARLLNDHGYQTSDLSPGSRAQPDGSQLTWTTVSISGQKIVGAPFFIQWSVDSAHPASTSPAGCELNAFTIRTPDHRKLQDLVGVLECDVAVEESPGPEATFSIELQTPKGLVTIS